MTLGPASGAVPPSSATACFALLFLATLGSGVGTYAATIALTADIASRTHSTWWVSLLFIVTFLPSIVVGVFIGPLIDRLSRKMLIVISDVVRLAVFALLPFADHPRTMIVLAAAAGIANSFFRPAVLAGVPNLVEERELDAATSLLQGTEWLAAAIGPVIAGALVSLSGAHIVYWMNAATFLFSAVLILRIPGRLLQSEQGVTRGHWRDLHDGFAAFRSSVPLRVALYGFGLDDDRDGTGQRQRDLPREAIARIGCIRLRAALDGLRHRPRRGQHRHRAPARATRRPRAYVYAFVPAHGRHHRRARPPRTSGSRRRR